MLDSDAQDGEFSISPGTVRNRRGSPVLPGELKIPKNRSTGHLPGQAVEAPTRPSYRLSFDAGAIREHDASSRLPVMTEHEHGLGCSGLRRIRQQPQARHPTLPSRLSASLHRTGLTPTSNLTLSLPSSRVVSHSSTGPSSPVLTVGEDLTRFPAESLHSFSFTHQAEEPIHSRQNVLRRSIEFMRERPGWVAASPGLVSAQAKVSGDAELQSMMELLSRAGLMASDDEKSGAGLGLSGGPLTGPAEVQGVNLFERSFAPLSSSPDELEVRRSRGGVSQAKNDEEEHTTTSIPPVEPDATSVESQHPPSDGSTTQDPNRGPIPRKGPGRGGLKRTFTDLEPLSIQEKLMDTLAVPYLATDGALAAQASPTFVPGSAVPPLAGPSAASAALHAHSSRWAPAAQAIFTTQASPPWTILAANDLACLVFGVTKAEVRKLGILEVVREDRRAWLEERLRTPESDANAKPQNPADRDRPTGPTSTISPSMGNGVTAYLLNKPSWRDRRAKTGDNRASKPPKRADHVDSHHPHTRSRGVLLCGDVVPIQKRNGATGAASLWVKEKRGGLIWVLEEITEDVAYLELDHYGRVARETGSTAALWGFRTSVVQQDISRLIPQIPRTGSAGSGDVDYAAVTTLPHLALRNAENAHIPATVEANPRNRSLRVASFPHIAGMMVISASTLKITSSNAVFSAALFGRSHPDGLPITDLIPDFDRILELLFQENGSEPVDGLVIPEYSFRRARALLAIREGKPDAAMALLHPNGLPATHRDGSDLKVDVQMRVVRSGTLEIKIDDDVIEEADEEVDGTQGQMSESGVPEVMYALWITYSRQLHSTGQQFGGITSPLLARCESPPHQPSPGQTQGQFSPPDADSDVSTKSNGFGDQLSEQIREAVSQPIAARRPEVGSVENEKQLKSPKQHQRETKAKPTKQTKKTIDDFVILEDMGQGAYGQVKLARYKQNGARKMVLKYVTKRRILVDTWTRDRRLGTVPLEIHVLDYLRRDGLKHPNIVEMSDFFEDDLNYYIEMVPHGLPGMDLFDYIELRVNMEESECRSIFRQVANAVHHLHTKALVVHRDIKDENVILDGEGNIKLIDFGSATYIKNGPFDVFVGTIDYAAPEVLAGHSYGGKEQDVWALGILLYTIVYKENPFYSIDEIMDHGLRVPFILSENCIDLIRLMLNRAVDERINITQVLNHPWLVDD